MQQILNNNWYWILLLGVVILGLWYAIAGLGSQREAQSKGRRVIRRFMWGPFAGSIENYLIKRGGFTKRERFGWAVVGTLMLIVIITSLTEAG
jgi:hypothetical protein